MENGLVKGARKGFKSPPLSEGDLEIRAEMTRHTMGASHHPGGLDTRERLRMEDWEEMQTKRPKRRQTHVPTCPLRIKGHKVKETIKHSSCLENLDPLHI